MANIRYAQLLTAILIVFFVLDCFSVVSASVPLGQERIHSSWYFGGKSRKLYSFRKPLTYFKERPAAAASLRQAAPGPPSPQASQPPPRK